ncbi:hypothetical protein VF673_11835 [Halopseudomonas sp. Lyrl_26]|uniref:hypothetical protein n=1 Tax=Halopseudomonas sp. Lyrl_26 TaxID=3110923 RepID=UPI003F7F9B54
MLPIDRLKSLVVPLLVLVGVNLVAVAWRAIPPQNELVAQDASWEALEPLAAGADVRHQLLQGGQWGQPVEKPADQDAAADAESKGAAGSSEAAVQALSKHIQRQLQGIIRRGGWVLLFAQPTETDGNPPLPLELRSGDVLPDTPWQIGQIWADRVQLVQQGHDPLIVPLYPVAESVTEP